MPTEPEQPEMVDLSWVTFSEKDPSVPCKFIHCAAEAMYNVYAEPCGHSFPFCDPHAVYTQEVLRVYQSLSCTQCEGIVPDITLELIKRG